MTLSSNLFYRFLLFIMAFSWLAASAQSCPTENPTGPPKESTVVTTRGTIVYHEDLRQWFGFLLDAPVCGQKELQLITTNDERWKEFEILRGCKAVIDGELSIPGTGYYSTEIYQVAQAIHPDVSCVRQPPFPDMSHVEPRSGLRRYQVKIMVSYRNGGSIRTEAHAGKQHLTPWQAYTSHMLTGGFVLYGTCNEHFSMSHVSGSPEANPSQTDEQAAIDPETAAQKKVDPIFMTFTCTRDPKKNAAPK